MDKQFHNRKVLAIAGVSCAGKSCLINSILNGKAAFTVDNLNLDLFRSAGVVDFDYRKFDENTIGNSPFTIVHFGVHVSKSVSRLEFIKKHVDSVDDITFVTLICSLPELRRRARSRLRKNVTRKSMLSPGYFSKIASNARKIRRYRSARKIHTRLERWFQLLEDNGIKESWVLDSSFDDYPSLEPASRQNISNYLDRYFKAD